MHILRMLSLTLLVTVFGAAPALAQQSSDADTVRTLSSSALDAMLAGHESAVNQERAKLADLLSRTDVHEVAHDRGIDIEQVESAAAGLSDAEVNAVAPIVATITTAADKGALGSVTISVVALIVILLVVILIA
ncbi:MAG: hypothetical protein RQ745_09035 [Longimicrobiales bacterium]|nr:hypothetical protein [Longimicrobiales bacterium]